MTEHSPTLPPCPKSGISPRAKACIDKMESITLMGHRNESLNIQKHLKFSILNGHCDRRRDCTAWRRSILWQGNKNSARIITVSDPPLVEGLNLGASLAKRIIVARIGYATALLSRHIRNDVTEVEKTITEAPVLGRSLPIRLVSNSFSKDSEGKETKVEAGERLMREVTWI